MSFTETWQALRKTSADSPESRRRIAPNSFADIWLVLKGTQKLRTLRIMVTDAKNLEDLPNGLGISVNIVGVAEQTSYLEVSLINESYADVFDVFVEDLANAACAVESRAEVAGAVAQRIDKWQSFLRKKIDGLSPEKVRGLFGELKVLEWIGDHFSYNDGVNCWVGPQGFSQDFHLRDVAIEVKTSATKNPQSIQITSERQLDSKNLELLALWHWSVDERLDHGESLPSLIAKIRRRLLKTMSQDLFENRIFEVGYLDAHSPKYQYGFTIRNFQVFQVKDDFPRIVERDCPDGLGAVSYSVQLGAISKYAISDDSLLSRINLGNN